jgi:signal peptidase I
MRRSLDRANFMRQPCYLALINVTQGRHDSAKSKEIKRRQIPVKGDIVSFSHSSKYQDYFRVSVSRIKGIILHRRGLGIFYRL